MTAPLTPEQLAEMKQRADDAVKWWRAYSRSAGGFANDVLALLAEIERLTKANEKLCDAVGDEHSREADAWDGGLAGSLVDAVTAERDVALAQVERTRAEVRTESQAQEERGLSLPHGPVRRMHMWISGRLCAIANCRDGEE